MNYTTFDFDYTYTSTSTACGYPSSTSYILSVLGPNFNPTSVRGVVV